MRDDPQPRGDDFRPGSSPSPDTARGPAPSSRPQGSWQPPTPEELQEQFPEYKILDLLGRGGMGAVYQGWQTSLERYVAIKILPPDGCEGDEEFSERFKLEARTMAKFQHPGIVSIYDAGETPSGLLYIVMEFIEGTDVAKMIKSQGRLPPGHALAITAHVCDALQYAHSHGVIHRDIKPANVLMNMEGEVKVADFGLAKTAGPSQGGLTRSNMAMGTPDYLAPEALIMGLDIDGRADLYAVGVMLYDMLTGQVPRGVFEMPSVKTKGETDVRFDAIIARAMEQEREKRYQNAYEIRQDLDVILTTPKLEAQGQASSAIPKHQLVAMHHAAPRQKPMARRPGELARLQAKQVVTYVPKRKSRLPAVTAGMVLAAGSFLGWQKFTSHPTRSGTAPSSPAATTTQPGTGSLATTAQPDGVLSFGGHRYKFLRGPFEKDEDRNNAAALGGHLLTISSEEEQKWIEQTFSGVISVNGKGQCRTGGRRSDDGAWAWMSGEPFSYSNWASGFPEPEASSRPILVLKQEGEGLKWRQTHWSDKGAAIVEWNDSTTPIPSAAPTSPLASARPAPPDAHAFGGHRYKFIRGDVSWNEANERAAGMGGHLATLTSPEEDEWVCKTFVEVLPPEKILQIGGFKPAGSKLWLWITGEPWSFENWDKGKPDDTPDARGAAYLNLRGKHPRWAAKWLPASKVQIQSGDLQGQSRSEGFLVEWDDDRVSSPVIADAGGETGDMMSFGGHRYKLVRDIVTWREARAQAEAVGGHLATITTKEENDWIAGNFIAKLERGLSLWIGGTREGTPDKWRWITGEDFSFTAWASGEPSPNEREIALTFSFTDGGDLAWGDIGDSGIGKKDRRAGFLVEWDQAGVFDRLAQIEAQFKEAYKRDALRDYDASVADLDGKYLAALDRAIADATKAGKLDDVVALRSEKQHITNKTPPPPTDPLNIVASLKKLRDTYRGSLAPLTQKRDAAAEPVYARYDQELAALQTELTQKNAVSDAQVVKSLREALEKQRQLVAAEPMVAAALQSTPLPSKPAETQPKKDSPKKDTPKKDAVAVLPPEMLSEPVPKPFSPQEAMQWALSLGGGAKIKKGSVESEVLSVAKLPKGSYTVIGLKLGEKQPLHVVSLAALSGLADLRDLTLDNNLITDAGLAFLPKLPKLAHLSLGGCGLTDAGLDHLAKQTALTHLGLSNNSITGSGLRSIAGLQSLTTLEIGSPALADEHVANIASFGGLATLDLSASKPLSCTSLAPLAGVKSLKRITLGRAATDPVVQSLGALVQVETLDLNYAPISDYAFERIGTMKGLRDLELYGCPNLTDVGFAKLQGLKGLLKLNVGRTRLTDSQFVTLSTKLSELTELDINADGMSDAGLAGLANLRKISKLNIHARMCTDLGLGYVRRLANLRVIGIDQINTMSQARFDTLKRGLPRVDFGRR